MVLVGVPLAVCWLYCAALLRNFFLVEELTLLPDVAPTTVRLKVCFPEEHSQIFGIIDFGFCDAYRS